LPISFKTSSSSSVSGPNICRTESNMDMSVCAWMDVCLSSLAGSWSLVNWTRPLFLAEVQIIWRNRRNMVQVQVSHLCKWGLGSHHGRPLRPMAKTYLYSISVPTSSSKLVVRWRHVSQVSVTLEIVL
jgi:hypothetical protein